MIEKYTLFIVGAGGSMPFDYPSGQKLYDMLIGIGEGDFNEIAEAYITHIDGDGTDHEDAISDIKKIQMNMKLASEDSVDVFAYKRQHDINVDILKIMVCKIIYEHEEGVNKDLYEAHTKKRDWYATLFNQALKEIDSPEFRISELSHYLVGFVTFNYDLSLEHFIYKKYVESKSVKEDKFRELMNAIPIIHPYGTISKKPWEEGYTRNRKKILFEAPSNIKLMYENSSSMKGVKVLMTQAKSIFFIGFGYHRDNIKYLKVESFNGLEKIAGTSYKMSPQQIKNARADISNILLKDIDLEDMNANEYIRTHIQY